jgi:hypothetical protein
MSFRLILQLFKEMTGSKVIFPYFLEQGLLLAADGLTARTAALEGTACGD